MALRRGYFQGGANLSEGQKSRQEDKTLRELLNKLGPFTNSSVVTSTYTADFLERVRYDASGGTFQINAPFQPEEGDRFGIKEYALSANDVIISGNGVNIEHPDDGSKSASITVGQAGIGVMWEFDGTLWIIP